MAAREHDDVPAIVIELGERAVVSCNWDDPDDAEVAKWFDSRPKLFRLIAELIDTVEADQEPWEAA
jgi:hypothetical protein